MGSPAFAVPSLRALHASGYEVALVVSQPDRPAGRGGGLAQPAVKVAAAELGLPVLQPETLKDEAVRAQLRSLEADVTVVAAYGKILAPAVLRIPRLGSVNVHASLLPRWRGASPIAAALLAGESETGVSIMEMTAELDAGPVIARAPLPIPPGATAGTLEPALAALGARTLVETLPRWASGEVAARPQDESLATFCGLVRKEDGQLRAAMTAVEAERAVRAYDPWPGAYVDYRGSRLAAWRAHVALSPRRMAAGTTMVVERKPAIAFAHDLLVLDEVQRQGGKRIAGETFLNGERGTLPGTVGLA